ncbi:hypothetical protein MNBD_CHLOROFLEXI01-4609 [hydrothermal vent metagenome]|uniref:DUF4177 domain-containing protein n=1 Tax=hydrothermal vent metagenome TaxID=652676 RepID=A0A3B0UXK5_9ZZZZ
MQQWEYLTLFIEASKDVSMAYTAESETLARFSPQTMMPEMDRLGAKGWELVHMQPAYVGKNDDILMHEGGGIRQWTSKYFCVFKRPT